MKIRCFSLHAGGFGQWVVVVNDLVCWSGLLLLSHCWQRNVLLLLLLFVQKLIRGESIQAHRDWVLILASECFLKIRDLVHLKLSTRLFDFLCLLFFTGSPFPWAEARVKNVGACGWFGLVPMITTVFNIRDMIPCMVTRCTIQHAMWFSCISFSLSSILLSSL